MRGRVKAFDAKDGKLVWTFYTVPGPGEPGHDTWPKRRTTSGSTAAAPYGRRRPSIPSSGSSTSRRATRAPTTTARIAPATTCYTASIVALEAKTGKYRWHFQQVHHDLWDYDAAEPRRAVRSPARRRHAQGLAEVGKTGWAYILDRTTGKPLVGDRREARAAGAARRRPPRRSRTRAATPSCRSTSRSRPKAFKLVNDGRIFTPFAARRPTLVNPGIWGGANWPPSSYDPAAQSLFVCASSVVGRVQDRRRPDVDGAARQGKRYLGGVTGITRLPRMGIFAALDLTTNTLRWRYHWPEQCYSGSVATAGGLVFVGRNDGRLTALDSSDRQAALGVPNGRRHERGREHRSSARASSTSLAYSAGNALIGSARGDSSGCSAWTARCRPRSPARPRGGRRIRNDDPHASRGAQVGRASGGRCVARLARRALCCSAGA